MKRTRIAVLVSGGGTNLQALLDAQQRGELAGGEIVAVISSHEKAYALQRAKAAEIPTFLLLREEYQTPQALTHALVVLLREQRIDLVVMAGFLTILSEELFAHYPNAVINIHPSLIPAFCGAGCYGIHVHEKVLEYGVKVSGATVHFVNEDCDAGPIIAQRAVEILPADTPQSLQRRIMEQCEWQLLVGAVADFCQGKLKVCGRIVEIGQ